MRIISLNAWGGTCWDALRAWLPKCGADVLCLQEMIRAPGASPAWLEYRDPCRTLAQRADLFADVSACMPTHQASFAPAARGPLSDALGRVHLSEHGLGMWIAPHLAVTARWQGFIHGTFRADGWGPEPVPRTMQLARIASPQGHEMTVGHLHGIRLPGGKGDTVERTEQARNIVRAVSDFTRPDEPIALGGDFNLLPGSATFEALNAIGLRDLVTQRGIPDTRTALYKKPQRHANYMCINSATKVKDFKALAEPVVSDHRALVLDVAV